MQVGLLPTSKREPTLIHNIPGMKNHPINANGVVTFERCATRQAYLGNYITSKSDLSQQSFPGGRIPLLFADW